MSARGLVIGSLCLCASSFLTLTASADPVTERITLTNTGLQTNGGCWWPTLSADGRFMAYHSSAVNIITGDTNGVYDVYVLDRLFRVSHLISVSGDGVIGNEESLYPVISADGRSVAFCSEATNLVPGDVNGLCDIFVRDWDIGVTELLSVSTSGEQANQPSDRPWPSADGRYVVFQSRADNLVSGVGGNLAVFLRDRLTGTTTCASVSAIAEPANEASFEAIITPDGRYVVFSSWASNLVLGDTNLFRDLFIRDLQTGLTERVSVSTEGTQGNERSGGARPAITPDGRYVAFSAIAGNLVPDDTNGVSDVFVRDRLLGTTERVSVSSSGEQGDGPSGEDAFILSVSADGRYVAFASAATNLVPGDTNDTWDLFIHDRETGTTTRASVSQAGTQGNDDSGYYGVALESDGAFVVFDSQADNLVEDDTNNAMDVFLRGDATPTSTPMTIINGDALSTAVADVTLSIHAGACSELRFRNEGGGWTGWEASANTRAWVLPPGEGLKRVYLQGREGLSESEVTWDDIFLDTTPPSGLALSINNDAAYATSVSVALTVGAPGAAEMRFRNESSPWSDWGPAASQRRWDLSVGDGTKRVYLQTRDEALNESEEAYDEIVLDTQPPTALTIAINGGAAATASHQVTLSLSVSGATEMRLRNESAPWSEWEPVAATKAWILSPSQGEKVVAFQCHDIAGNLSAEASDTIELVGFTDVPEDFWAYQQIMACVEADIVGGYPDGAYHPGETVTRAQMAVYISRALAAGDDHVPTGPPTATFPDVATDYWAFKYVEYAHDEEVVGGYWDGTYRPGEAVDRAAMAVYVSRAIAGGDEEVPDDPDGVPFFPDVLATHWAYRYVEYCHDQEVVTGYWDGTYRPAESVTRAQMAVYVARAFEL